VNLTQRNQWITWAIVGAAPFAGALALRTMSGVGGPIAAVAAPGFTENDSAPVDPAEMSGAHTHAARTWAVRPTDGAAISQLAAENLNSWNTPLFVQPAPLVAQSPMEVPLERPIAHPVHSPSGPEALGDHFQVSSLMNTRTGPMAVIDRKLRRVGETLEGGVVVDSIDLDARAVVLRTPNGTYIERRTSR